MTTMNIVLAPRDGFAFKDGRGWFSAETGRGSCLAWPFPSTIRGAVTTCLGRAVCKEPDQWRRFHSETRLSALLGLRRPIRETAWTLAHRIWPVAADALFSKDGPHRLMPMPGGGPPATLGCDEDETRERLWWPRVDEQAKPAEPPQWWGEDEFAAWLCGETTRACQRASEIESERRRQVNVRLDTDRLTAAEGALFSQDIVEPLSRTGGIVYEWALAARCQVSANTPWPDFLTLGSDQRLASISHVPAELFDIPAQLKRKFAPGAPALRLVVITPAFFERGWLPDGFQAEDGQYRGRLPGLDHDFVLRAAFVRRPLAVSGWDMAGSEPKPTDRLVPHGSVFFFQRYDRAPVDASACDRLWLAALGGRTDDGFGRVVPGVWNPAQSQE